MRCFTIKWNQKSILPEKTALDSAVFMRKSTVFQTHFNALLELLDVSEDCEVADPLLSI